MSCNTSNVEVNQSNTGNTLSEEKTKTEAEHCCSDENSESQSYSHQSTPVSSQPKSNNVHPNNWLNLSNGSLNCPPGLEYLESIEQLFLKQKVELFAGIEKNIKFDIKDATGQIIYQAKECNECFTRGCCGSNRPFTMKIFDIYQREVLHFVRPCTFSGFCGPHYPELLEVFAPPGQQIGRIEEVLDSPQFLIKNLFDEVVLRIEAPFCANPSSGNIIFQIFSSTGIQTGQITKHGFDLSHDIASVDDNFAINFAMDLDVFMKAIILGACIFIDSMFFERKTANTD